MFMGEDGWEGKTSESKTSGGYGRHTSRGSSRSAMDHDVLGEATEMLQDGSSGYSAGPSQRERMQERERQRARQRAAGSFGGAGVARSAKPGMDGMASPVKAREFSRPRQNLMGPRFSEKPKGGFSGFDETTSFDPFESDEEELPAESSFRPGPRAGGRARPVAEPMPGNDRDFVEDDFESADRWEQREAPKSSKKKKSSRRKDEGQEYDSSEDSRHQKQRSRPAKPKRRTVKDYTEEEEDDVVQEIRSPARRKNERLKESTRKGPRPPDAGEYGGKRADDEAWGGAPPSSAKKKKKKKKGGSGDSASSGKAAGSKKKEGKRRGAPRPPSDDDDEDDDMHTIDPSGRDRRGLSKEERLARARQRVEKEREDVAVARTPKRKGKAKGKAKRSEVDDNEVAISSVPDKSNMRQYLMTPARRREGIIQCYIVRKRNGPFKKMYPEYHLYLTDGDTFLMAAKKRSQNTTSNYLISADPQDMSRKSSSYLGKLRSNFLGTEFTIYDNGMNPNSGDTSNGSTRVREEFGISLYASNVLGSRGPRKMRVCVPVVDERTNRRVVFQPQVEADGMLAKFKDKEKDELFYMINKPPRWNDQVGAYVLNFNGRVTMASVKNFQLINPDDQERVVLQFGRVAKDKFTMDFQGPLCPFQAFALCLSSFDYKLACE
jgi:tubby and related proteins